MIWSHFRGAQKLESYYRDLEEYFQVELDLGNIKIQRPKIQSFFFCANHEPENATPTVDLWTAAVSGNTAAIRQHVAAGTDLNQQESVGGSTPLVLAAIFGQLEVAEILIEAEAAMEVPASSGGTAIHMSCFFCHPEITELLLKSGADENKTNGEGNSPIQIVNLKLDSNQKAIYQHVYHNLGFEVDFDQIEKSRKRNLEILTQWQNSKWQSCEPVERMLYLNATLI